MSLSLLPPHLLSHSSPPIFDVTTTTILASNKQNFVVTAGSQPMLIRWKLGFGSRLLIGGMKKLHDGRMRFVRSEKGFGMISAVGVPKARLQSAATVSFSSSSLIHDFLVTEAKVENPPRRLSTVLEILKVS